MSFTPEQITEILQIYFDNFVTQTYTGMRYVPIIGRRGESSAAWDNSEPYEPLTIVTYSNESYTSRQYVPAGVAITNTDYWVKTGAYNAQIVALQDALPSSYFDSALTVKDYVDTLASFLPASDFDNDNTVKAYVDGLADLLPSSAFDSVNTVRGALNGRVRAFETVADMAAATDLAADMICHTNGFHTSGDGGAAFYEIKSIGTANAMDIIACQDSLLAHLVVPEIVTPEMFGAYGDDTNDDTSVLQYVFSNFFNITSNATKTYKVSDAITVPAKVCFNGNECRINSTATTDIFTFSGGYHVFENVIIYGNNTNKGLSGSSYYGRFTNVYINNVDYGVYFVASANKVENHFEKLKIYANTCCFYAGESNTSRLTDGFLQDCDFSLLSADGKHVFIGGCIGWEIANIHTYGEIATYSIDLRNVSNTNLTNIEIENYKTHGIYAIVSNELNISNVVVSTTGSGRPFYLHGRNNYVVNTPKIANLTNIKFDNDGTTTYLLDNGNIYIKAYNVGIGYKDTSQSFVKYTDNETNLVSIEGKQTGSISHSDSFAVKVHRVNTTSRRCFTINIIGASTSALADNIALQIYVVYADVSGTFTVSAGCNDANVTVTASGTVSTTGTATINISLSGVTFYGAYEYDSQF